MRAFVAVVAACVALAHGTATAQDAEPLRKELAEMHKQLETMKTEYEKAIQAMAERLRRLEARPRTAATQPVITQAPVGGQPSLQELARPREPFALYERRGPGQLLFDIGIVADFVGNVAQRNVDKANAGTFAGRENRFLPREIELLLFGQIDPYARGEVRLETGEKFEDGRRKTEVELAEANLTLLTLPFGTQLKLGQMRNRFGLLNQSHREALPQPDAPNVLSRFFGEEGLVEKGFELSWLPPLPFYLETLAGVFNGDNETAFGRGSLKAPLATGRLRTFFELDRLGAIQLGLSGASGETAARRLSTLAGFDAKYKLTPEGWRHPLFTLAGEAIYSNRNVTVTDDAGAGENRTRERFGWYAYGEVQPWKRWAGGLRYDSTQFPVNPGREWAVEPYVSFMPSDFLRFRLAHKHTERSHRDGFTDNGGSARIVDELLFQATFFLGAHPAHPF